MKILFDHGTPAPLRRQLAGHEISTAYEMGWATLSNGDLLAATEKSFDASITTDQNLRYQQNFAGRRLAILVLPTTSWPEIQKHTNRVAAAVNALQPGDFCRIEFLRGTEFRISIFARNHYIFPQ
jgi:hypothetical protein